MVAIKEFIISFIIPTFLSLGQMLLKIVLIITIVMFAIEILKAFKILDWLNKKLFFFSKHLGISTSASFPLLVGMMIGITYGAGVILISYKNGEMSKKDVILVSVFLCLAHALFEDILLFVALGAKGLIVLISKLLIASSITFITNLLITKNNLIKNKE